MAPRGGAGSRQRRQMLPGEARSPTRPGSGEKPTEIPRSGKVCGGGGGRTESPPPPASSPAHLRQVT